MRSFFWKFVLCLAPCVLAGWVTVVALGKYFAGESGGFKLGVDLVGGTILVYEIDLRKQEGADKKNEGGFDPKKDINVLAEALKKRIDPNDLYNIVIRPAGGEGRVEIILPTGGAYRSEKADKDWKDLVAAVAKQFEIKDTDKLKVPRGRIFELADAVQLIKSQNLWGEKLLNNQQAWNRMTQFTKPSNKDDLAQAKYKKDFADLLKADPKAAEAIEKEAKANEEYNRPIIERNNQDPKSAEFFFGADLVSAKVETDTGEQKPAPEVIYGLWSPGKAVDLNELTRVIDKALANTPSATNEAVIKNWIKSHAWNQLLQQALEKWTWLRGFEEPTEEGKKGRYLIQRIPPDNNEQLIGFIQSGGTFIGQASLYALDNIIGANPLETYEPPADAKDNHIEPYKPVKEFIESRYGYSHRSIVKDIQARAKEQGRGRDLTVEEVQRIKEQVARVGLLEFRILANEKDDAAAIEAVKAAINSGNVTDLKERAEKGLPPPGPIDDITKEPKIFPITVAHGDKSFVTYSWVELSRQQRRDLDLDNAARDDTSRRTNHWKQAETQVDKVFTLVDQDQAVFKGAVFFKRLCRDRNISPEERDSKKWEYFILTRDPEFEQKDGKLLLDAEGRPVRTPRIDGGYLTNAAAGQSNDLRPAVHFAFNDAGANLFGAITSKNVPDESGSAKNQMVRHLAIILDGEVMSAPTIQSTIRDRGQISGNFTQKEIEALVNTLRAGRLPATLKPEPVSESTMGPTLGQDTIQAGVISILIAFGAVLAFMVVYYRFAGLVASVALLANLLLTVGFMTAVQATFTLPGLAGLVLMLGMAVDANILIYERLREERDRGATLALAIRNGYDRALPTIIDTHLSSIFTAVVLYIVGNDQLKGFGVSLTVGLLISLFTSLYMTRLLFDFWLSKGWLHKLSMFRFLTKPNVDFMAIRRPMFIITLTLAILGFALFFGRAPFNIDFVGGTAFGSQLTKPVTIVELRELVSDKRQAKVLDIKEVKEAAPITRETTPEADAKADKKDKTKKRTAEFGSGRYTIVYADGKEREVQLLNPPEKATKEEREQAVKAKASHLADETVEQQFPSFAKAESGKSAYFVVRTSEKEPELVQAALDRLLRDDKGETLLRRTYIEVTPKLAERIITIQFFDKNPAEFKSPEGRVELEQKHKADGSPLFIKSLFSKELLIELGLTDKRDLPAFEVRGEGAGTPDGQYHTLVIKLEKKPEEDAAKIEAALQKTQDSFNGYIQPDRLENFDSQLATETRYRALWAILASWLAILVYLWFRFGSWTFGLAAVICLIHDLFITLGFIAVAHYLHGTFIGDLLGLEDFKVDLPAVAALLTLVGYSVNDTIVVFDRIREVRGKNPDLTSKMINDSVNQTLSRTILSSTTTWLVVFVLYVWGGPGVHLFSFIMVVGVVVGTYSSIYIASPLLLLFREGHKETGPRTARPTPEPSMA